MLLLAQVLLLLLLLRNSCRRLFRRSRAFLGAIRHRFARPKREQRLFPVQQRPVGALAQLLRHWLGDFQSAQRLLRRLALERLAHKPFLVHNDDLVLQRAPHAPALLCGGVNLGYGGVDCMQRKEEAK